MFYQTYLCRSEDDEGNLTLKIFLLVVSCSITLGFLPTAVMATTSAFKVCKRRQPMFMLFGAVFLGCIVNLCCSAVESVGLLSGLNGCQVLGTIKLCYFFSMSMQVSVICILRALAVSRPLFYKTVMKPRIMVWTIVLCLGGALIGVVTVQGTGLIEFEYVGAPRHVGCTLLVATSTIQVEFSCSQSI